MDPLSIATGVAGLVLLAYQCAQEVDKLIQEYQNVPTELSKLASQIQHISAALGDFRDFFLKRVIQPNAAPSEGGRPGFMPNQKWLDNMERLLTSLVGTIRDLERILRKMGGKRNKVARHFKWTSLQAEVSTLQRDLDRNVQTLLVMMSTFTSMSDAYLREEVQHISLQVSASKTPKPSSEVAVSEVPPAPGFKVPSFSRTNSSFALLSSFPSFSLFRTESSKSEPPEDAQPLATEPPPYSAIAEAKRQLTWVTGCYHHGEERFYAITRPWCPATTFCYSRDPSDMQAKFKDAVAQGLKMSSVNVYAAPDGSTRYCHTYVRPASEKDQVPWYAAWDLDLGSFVAQNMDLSQAGYACVHLNACSTPVAGTVFAGIWEKSTSLSPASSEVVHSVNLKELTAINAHYCTGEIGGDDRGFRNHSGTCSYEGGTGYIKFATVLVKRGDSKAAAQAQVTKHLLSRADLEKEIVELRKDDYHVVSVNPFILTGQELFNCTWEKFRGSEIATSYIGITREALERVEMDLERVDALEPAVQPFGLR